MKMHAIVRATPADAAAVAELIGGAFQHLEVSSWLVPDPVERARVLPRNFQIFVDYALQHGTVEVAADGSGASVWLPMDGDPLPPPDNYEQRVADSCGAWTENFLHLDTLFEANHPHAPHHHLAFLGVHPDRQSGGVGSALLDSYHHRLDGAGTAAFLEASSARSRDLYLRHGYTPLGEPYAVPNGALFYPMWREPRRV
jgi:ribosomal protein S18 acetylase RimI-like enzyme